MWKICYKGTIKLYNNVGLSYLQVFGGFLEWVNLSYDISHFLSWDTRMLLFGVICYHFTWREAGFEDRFSVSGGVLDYWVSFKCFPQISGKIPLDIPSWPWEKRHQGFLEIHKKPQNIRLVLLLVTLLGLSQCPR